MDTLRCSRGLAGISDGSARPPSGKATRHDYLVVDGDVHSFMPAGSMLRGEGVVTADEKSSNGQCEVISTDPAYDQAVKEASKRLENMNYAVLADPSFGRIGMAFYSAGYRNCQTWIDSVLTVADSIYSQ